MKVICLHNVLISTHQSHVPASQPIMELWKSKVVGNQCLVDCATNQS